LLKSINSLRVRILRNCQAHRDSIVYLVANKRRSKKWERKKELWELINPRRLTSLTNSPWYWSPDWMNDTRPWHTDHLTEWVTRNRDTTLFSFLIRQGSSDASCSSDGTILTSCFDISIVSFDAKSRSLLSNAEFHLYFHFIQNVFDYILCLLYVFSRSTERIDEVRH
jgi:hypothetical protein